MAYEYSDPTRANDPHAQPDVEVFDCRHHHCPRCGHNDLGNNPCTCGGKLGAPYMPPESMAWWYAFGFPGCLWDSDPVGPFSSYDEALTAAREVE